MAERLGRQPNLVRHTRQVEQDVRQERAAMRLRVEPGGQRRDVEGDVRQVQALAELGDEFLRVLADGGGELDGVQEGAAGEGVGFVWKEWWGG